MGDIAMDRFPKTIHTGFWPTGHIQGIAVDPKGEYIYYSFTTVLVKARLDGSVVGWVDGIIGHLGCIDFNDEDGRVYGSLELKHDSIGQGIMRGTGIRLADEDAFYIVIFDVDRITAPKMDAERDGIMQAVYLPDVVSDYAAVLPNGMSHKYACSGVDGLSIGPVFGEETSSPTMLMIAYGVYGDVTRDDNDCNVILQYDWRTLGDYARPLCQQAPHHSGPAANAKYFIYTGNTTWGVQNLEYDAFSGDWLMAVYRGKKTEYPNYPMFIIDGAAKPRDGYVAYGEKGCLLSLKNVGPCHAPSGICGCLFERGSTGVYSFGNGYYYFSEDFRTEDRMSGSIIRRYRREKDGDALFLAQ